MAALVVESIILVLKDILLAAALARLCALRSTVKIHLLTPLLLLDEIVETGPGIFASVCCSSVALHVSGGMVTVIDSIVLGL